MNRNLVLILFVLFAPYISYAQTSKHINIVQEQDGYNFLPNLKENLNKQCAALCGNGYFYDRPGAKNNGKELVCTKYPLDCGYNCTIGWNFRYLVGGTNFTCQEAVQTR